jgi:hypothetical protein
MLCESAKTISSVHNTLFMASSILSAWLKAMIDVEIFAIGSVEEARPAEAFSTPRRKASDVA